MTGHITELRLRMLANGYTPLPASGKIVPLVNWTTLEIGQTEVTSWEKRFPHCDNTGLRDPGLDVDIKDPEAAEAIRLEVNDWFGDRGVLLRRIGEAPKFLVPFRVTAPFGVINQWLEAPNGTPGLLQFLCAGQQFIAAGTHPGTRAPYTYPDGRDLASTPYSELPEIDEQEARELVGHLGDLLVERFGYRRTGGPHRPNGHEPSDAPHGPTDVEALLASMTQGNCNDVHMRIIPALIWRAWHPDKILDYLLAPTMEVWGGDKAQQAATILGRIRSTVRNLFMKEYDPASGEVPRWLAEEFHDVWAAALAQEKRPQLSRNASGWHIRAYGGEGEPKEDGANGSEHAKGGAGRNGNGGRRADKRPHLRDVTLSWWKPIDPATFPAREWLYGRHYQRQSVGLTTAPGGSGKTSADLLDAVAMATCRNLVGVQPEQRLRVWYHNAEDNLLEIQRRVLAICQRFDINQSELDGWLIVTTCEQFDLKVANGFNDLKLDEAVLEAISTKIQELEIDVAFFDPLINLHTTDEYNNVKMAQVLGALRSIAQAENCAMEVAQHTRKHPAGMTGDYTGADGRGAGSVRDAARSQRVLNVMGKDEAERHHIAEHERRLYVRIDIDKANNSPPQAAAWLRIVNVTLPNGDEVGVVEPWAYPGAAGPDDPARAAAEVQADTLFMTLLYEFTLQGRDVSHAPKSTNYAAKLFAEDPAAIDAKVGSVALKAAMARLFKAGRVTAADTGTGGKKRSILKAK